MDRTIMVPLCWIWMVITWSVFISRIGHSRLGDVTAFESEEFFGGLESERYVGKGRMVWWSKR